MAKKQSWITFSDPSSFGYLLWKDILVFPIFNDEGFLEIDFPKGSAWIYHFNHEKVFRDNVTVRMKVDLDESPIFLRENSTIAFADKYVIVYPASKNYSKVFYS